MASGAKGAKHGAKRGAKHHHQPKQQAPTMDDQQSPMVVPEGLFNGNVQVRARSKKHAPPFLQV